MIQRPLHAAQELLLPGGSTYQAGVNIFCILVFRSQQEAPKEEKEEEQASGLASSMAKR